MIHKVRSIKFLDNYKFNLKETILFLDVDSTMIVTNTDIFSDEWYKWQMGLDKNHEHVGWKNKEELLHLYDHFHTNNYNNSILIDKEMPKYLENLVKNGVKIIIITARNQTFKNLTFKQLSEHFNLNNFTEFIFTEGNNKAHFIEKTLEKYYYEHIIFFDDSERECNNVSNYLPHFSPLICNYLYPNHIKEHFHSLDKNLLHLKFLSYKSKVLP